MDNLKTLFMTNIKFILHFDYKVKYNKKIIAWNSYGCKLQENTIYNLAYSKVFSCLLFYLFLIYNKKISINLLKKGMLEQNYSNMRIEW